MMNYIHRYFGLGTDNAVKEKDDFSDFFYNAKSKYKVKIIREVMREATKKQESVLKRYRSKQVV